LVQRHAKRQGLYRDLTKVNQMGFFQILWNRVVLVNPNKIERGDWPSKVVYETWLVDDPIGTHNDPIESRISANHMLGQKPQIAAHI
jgi:hypothetical protein